MKKVYRLFVGLSCNNGDNEIPSQDVVDVVSRSFDSFTVYHEKGYFRGQEEDVLVVMIACDDRQAVYALGRTIRETFGQEGVGLEYDGHYHRITGDHHSVE